MPRRSQKPRSLVADGRTYLWTLRHQHERPDGRATNCRQVLVVHPHARGLLRIVFAEGPGRYVSGFGLGSGDVGEVHGGSLNLHEPGAVRALLDVALAGGWQPDAHRTVELDGWPLLDVATAQQARTSQPCAPTNPAPPTDALPGAACANPGKPASDVTPERY